MTDVADTDFESLADLGEVQEFELGTPDTALSSAGFAHAARQVQGGRASFEAVYVRLAERMHRLAFVLVDTDEQAAEVVQEAFAKLYPRFDKVESPEAYVRATVLNMSRRIVRRRGLARSRVRPEPEAPANPFDHVLDAVRRLPKAQRSVIVLRYYLQLTDEEIAS